MFMFWVWGPTLASVTQCIFPFPSSETTQGNDILASREDIGATCAVLLDMGHTHNLTVWWAFCLQSGKQSFICGPVVFLMARGFKSVFCTLWTRPACKAQNGPCPENRLVSQLFRMGANWLYISPSRGQSSTCYHEMFFSENCFKIDFWWFLYIQETPGTQVSFLNPWFLFH